MIYKITLLSTQMKIVVNFERGGECFVGLSILLVYSMTSKYTAKVPYDKDDMLTL